MDESAEDEVDGAVRCVACSLEGGPRRHALAAALGDANAAFSNVDLSMPMMLCPLHR